MNRDDDIHVPNLGPAESDRASASKPYTPSSARVSQPAPAEPKSGGGFIQSFVMLVLVGAVGALGYFGFEMYQTQQQSTAELVKSRAQIDELRQLLEVAEKGAETSGQTILGRLSSLEKNTVSKHKTLDSEVDKLWALSHRKNKPQIDAHTKTIAAQDKSIKALKSSVAKQEKQLKPLLALKSDTEKLQSSLKAQIADMKKLVQRMDAQISAGDELLQDEQEQQRKILRALTDRIAKVEGQSTSDLQRRIGLNEQAVRAFDSTRRQLNQDLFQVKQKLNNMQLQLEKR